MPIYEYVCDACQHRFELLKNRMMKDSREKCPSCGGTSRQQLSMFGVGTSAAKSSPCEDAVVQGRCPSSGGCSSGACPFSGM